VIGEVVDEFFTMVSGSSISAILCERFVQLSSSIRNMEKINFSIFNKCKKKFIKAPNVQVSDTTDDE